MPARSYIIWFTQRVGSTLLAHALEDTGVAGRPREWLNVPAGSDVLAHHRASNALELRDVLWTQGTTPNGVFGVKYGMTAALHGALTAVFRGLGPGDGDDRSAWYAMFPNCRHVFLARRNRVRLAVSWWRAIKSGEWHRRVGDATITAADLVDQYDAAALDHLLAEVSFREAGMQDLFDRWQIAPHSIFYEDLVADYEGTVREVLSFLELPEQISIPPPAFTPIADEVSEQWYRRFTAERSHLR